MKRADVGHCFQYYFFETPNICIAGSVSEEMKYQSESKCPDFYSSIIFLRNEKASVTMSEILEQKPQIKRK